MKTGKLTREFNEYNAFLKRVGAKPMTVEQYRLYKAGKLGNPKNVSVTKSPLTAETLRRESPEIPSGDTYSNFAAPKREKQYTGTKLIGIGVMHKSNLVPIFKKEDAEELARMRR